MIQHDCTLKSCLGAKCDWWSLRTMKWRRKGVPISKAGPLLDIWKSGEAERNSSSSFTQYIVDERFSVHRIILLVIGMWLDEKIIEKSYTDSISFIMTKSISISW